MAEDLVGNLGQDEGLAAFLPAVDEGADDRDDVFDRGTACQSTVVLWHAVMSFIYDVMIIAVTINVIAGLSA